MDQALRLRHQLIPYLYSMNVRSAKDGEALVQPMYWRYPDNREAYSVPNEFFFGSELLVMPMTSPRDKVTRRARARAWLPPGRYVDIFSGVVYDGDCEKWLYRALEDYAVLAREGSIIPFDADREPANGGPNPGALEANIIVGADGSFELYEDDGTGNGVEDVHWVRTPIIFNQISGTATIGPVSDKADFLPEKRDWRIMFSALATPESVHVFVDDKDAKKAVIKSMDSGTKVSLGAVSITSKIRIELGDNPQLAPTDPAKHIFPLVDGAQMEFEPKKNIWSAITAPGPLGVKLSKLSALGLDQKLLEAIMEYMCADSRSL